MHYALLVLMAAAFVAASPARYGPGGTGMSATSSLSYDGVLACVFELADTGRDGQLSAVELRIALRRWVRTPEQLLDGLTEHRLMQQCDTDRSGTISWAEAIEQPRCLSIPQVEGLAKWLCARAKHGNYVFSEYRATALAIEEGLVSGQGLKSVAAQFQALAKSRADVDRAALARQLQQPRLSDEVNSLVSDLGAAVSNVVVLPLAAIIIVIALLVACLV